MLNNKKQKPNIKGKTITWVLFLGLSVLGIFGGFGCARTVTPIFTYGDQMSVEVTLRGTPEVSSSRYFLVLSSNSGYNIPQPLPNVIDTCPEFIEPGLLPTTGTPEAYYATFFSTWAGYLVLDYSGYYLAKGPFQVGQTITREALGLFTPSGNKINFSFRLSRIFGTTVPSNIYFDLITVPWPNGAEKIPADHLPSLNNYISKVAGSTTNVDDLLNDASDPALDIVKCTISIQ